MGADAVSLAAEMTPYVSAAVGAYGGTVLAKVQDEVADATVRLGRRLLVRVFGSRGEGEPLPGPLADLAADPQDGDALAAVRLAVRRALTADPVLAAEVGAMLAGAPGVSQQVRAGRDVYTAGRDQRVVNYRRPGRVGRGGAVSGGDSGARQEIRASRDAYIAGPSQTINSLFWSGAGFPAEPGLTRRQVWGNIPARNPGFTGRAELLAAVRAALVAGDRAVVLALLGLGGVGKTQLAIEYVHRFAAEYDVVWWIAAEQGGLIGEQFAVLAAELGCAPAEAGLEALCRAVLAELRERGRWLLIFDYAEDPEDIAGWLPGSGGHVLVTSRAGDWAEAAVPVQVDVLARSESVAILRQRVTAMSEADADRLAEALGDLPLALAQAAGHMIDTSMPAGEYVSLLEARAAEILDHGRPSSYPKSLAAVTLLAVDRLGEEDPAASDLARLCAFLAPEPIPVQWFTRAAAELPSSLAGKAADPVAWRQVLARVSRHALVRIDDHGLQMHRLTAAIIRHSLTRAERAATRAAAERLLVAAAPAITGDPVTWPAWSAILPHLIHLDPATSPNGDLRELACYATLVLYLRGDYDSGQDLARGLHQTWIATLGEDHRDTLYAASNLGRYLFGLGDYEGARQLDQDTFTRRRRVLGEDHASTLHSASNLARDLQAMGDYQGARTILEDSLIRRRRIFGEDHPDTLHLAGRLAVTLYGLGDYRGARALQEDTLTRSRRVLGEDHASTLRSASNLARDLQAMGDYQGARTILEDSLIRRRRIFGEDHPDTLHLAGRLAVTLYGLGDYRGARALQEDTLTRSRRVLGEDDPDTLRSAGDLAVTLQSLGDHEDARVLHEDTLARMRRVLGADHPDTLSWRDGAAMRYASDHEEASRLAQQAANARSQWGRRGRGSEAEQSKVIQQTHAGRDTTYIAGGDQVVTDRYAGGTGQPPGETSTPGSTEWQGGRRYLKCQCPESASVGEPFSLLASVVLVGPANAALKPFSVPPGGRDVLLVLHAPGFRLLSRQRLTVHVPPDRDSEPVMFELRADIPGPQSVSITAWLGGSYLGELAIDITAERGRRQSPHRDLLAEIASEPIDGAVSLVVRYDRVQNAYRFEFRDEDNPDEVTSNLAYEPGPRVEQLVAALDGLAKGRSGYSAAQTRDYLMNSGAELWQELIPERLREQFWERQHRIRQLTILTDKDTVPWELLYPLDPGHDAGFLVEQFPVTRTIFGRRPARSLSLRPARFVLPEGSPPEAQAEVEDLQRLIALAPPESIISALTPLLDLIRSGDFGLLHFACHNSFDAADGSSITLDERQFTPTLMTTAVTGGALARNAPMVFLNACRSAGLSPTYNRLDGWATRFLAAGAAVFIGSLWAVCDATGREFAAELYRQLQEGHPLGQAVMQARQVAARQPGDPTWLAYTVYGDPRAAISTP